MPIDFSDLGAKTVQPAKTALDFSDLGATPVVPATSMQNDPVALANQALASSPAWQREAQKRGLTNPGVKNAAKVPAAPKLKTSDTLGGLPVTAPATLAADLGSLAVQGVERLPNAFAQTAHPAMVYKLADGSLVSTDSLVFKGLNGDQLHSLTPATAAETEQYKKLDPNFGKRENADAPLLEGLRKAAQNFNEGGQVLAGDNYKYTPMAYEGKLLEAGAGALEGLTTPSMMQTGAGLGKVAKDGGGRLIHAAANAYFGGSMAKAGAENTQQAYQHLKQGEYPEALGAGAEAALDWKFAKDSASGMAEDVKPAREATANVLRNGALGLMNRVVKPRSSDFDFGRDPGAAALDAGAWGITRKGVLNDVSQALHARTAELQSAVDNAQASIDLRPVITSVFTPRIEFLTRHGETRQAQELESIRDTYLQWPNIQRMSPTEATEFKREVGDLVKWSGDPLEATKADTRRKLYGGTKEQINQAVPGVAPLNNQVASLITAQKALQTAVRRDEVAPPISLTDVATDIAGGLPAALTRKMVTSPGGMSLAAQGLNKLAKAILPKEAAPTLAPAIPPMPPEAAPEMPAEPQGEPQPATRTLAAQLIQAHRQKVQGAAESIPQPDAVPTPEPPAPVAEAAAAPTPVAPANPLARRLMELANTLARKDASTGPDGKMGAAKQFDPETGFMLETPPADINQKLNPPVPEAQPAPLDTSRTGVLKFLPQRKAARPAPVEADVSPVSQGGDGKTVTVRRHIPDGELSTQELVERVKAQYPKSPASDVYGRFVSARHLKPEISMKQFYQLFQLAVPNAHIESEARAFNPTHIDQSTGHRVQIKRDSSGYELTWENGATGHNPGDVAEQYKPLASEPAQVRPPDVAQAPKQTAELGVGESVTYTPTKKYETAIAGKVLDRITSTGGDVGYHIMDAQGDVHRVWTSRGNIAADPAVSRPAQDRNIPPADVQAPQAAAAQIGDNVRVMGVESTLAQQHTADGVRYELYNGAKLKEPRAAVRVVDEDTGEVTALRQYPTYDAAEAAYLKAVRAVSSDAAPATDVQSPAAPSPNPLVRAVGKSRAQAEHASVVPALAVADKMRAANALARSEGSTRADGSFGAASPQVNEVGTMPTRAIEVNPARFQFKGGTDAEGVGTLLKDQQRYNPKLAGTLSVWTDPADGKTYVINGHHRLELAKRTGQPTVNVLHIDARNAAEARATGALQNIAEGRGTPVDAAKFLRETGMTVAELKQEGISLGEATAAKGVALAGLSDGLFGKVVNGSLPMERAVAIGEATPDHAEQQAIADLVERSEKKGRRITNDTLRELVKFVKGAGQTEQTTSSLFGDEQVAKSLALEKADISAYAKQQLAKDKRLFGYVANEGRASELERGNNIIDVNASRELAQSAAQGGELYDKLSQRAGPIADALQSGAQRLANGENAHAVKQQTYDAIRRTLSETLPGSEKTGDRQRAPREFAVAAGDDAAHYRNSARRGELDWGGTGLSPEQLDSWAKARSLQVEEAGEQPTLFGDSEKVYRITRTDADGVPEHAIVTQTQLETMKRASAHVDDVLAKNANGNLFAPRPQAQTRAAALPARVLRNANKPKK